MYIKNKNIIIKIICLLFLFSNISNAAEMDFKGELQFDNELPQYIQTPKKDLKEDKRVDKYLLQQFNKRMSGTYSYDGYREKGNEKSFRNKIKNALDNPNEYVTPGGASNGGDASLGILGRPTLDPKGTMSSHFGWRYYPSGFGALEDGCQFHGGIDIGGKSVVQKEIIAAADGKIIISERSTGGFSSFGNRVVIKHGDNLYTQYAHLSKRLVKVGETVKSGQVIGIMGNTGGNYAVHLHFEVLVANNTGAYRYKRDPLKYLNVKIIDARDKNFINNSNKCMNNHVDTDNKYY